MRKARKESPSRTPRASVPVAIASWLALWSGHVLGAVSRGASAFRASGWPSFVGFLRRHKHSERMFAIGLVIIALLEAFGFNAAYWHSLGTTAQPTDPLQATQQVGSGLRQESNHLMAVVDGKDSWIQIGNLHTKVETVYMNSTATATPDQSPENPPLTLSSQSLKGPSSWIEVRVQVLPEGSKKWVTGPLQSYSPRVPLSAYLRAPAIAGRACAIRVWFQQAAGSTFIYGQINVNARPGFVFSWLRVGLMVALLVFLIVFVDPRSAVWRMPYDPANHRWQIAVMSLLWLPLLIAFIEVAMKWPSVTLGAPKPGTPGNYTYESNQYARTADAILHGRPWLDLPVVPELAKARNPYSLSLRAQLFSQGVTPIFWDHAFWGGKWYMYFGVVPVFTAFLPFELFNLARTGQVLGLPPQTADVYFLMLFCLFGLFLLDRLLRRWMPGTKLGTAWLSGLMLVVGGNVIFLLFRPDFYAVPLANSLWMTALGLLLWLDARRVPNGTRKTRFRHRTKKLTRPWSVTDGSADWLLQAGQITLSRWRLVLGTILLAANIGSRPTFAISILLAFPIFWEEIRHALFFSILNRPLWRRTRASGRHLVLTGRMGAKEARRRGRRILFSSLRNDMCVILTGAITLVPILLWNYWRFGSLLDFGNRYQLTVVDLTNYREPLGLMPRIAYYYLFVPVRFSGRFPWMALVPTPLRTWQYTEPWMGGLFALVPFCALGLLAFVFLRLLARRGAAPFAWSLLGIGAILCLFESYYAGLSLRYMADFGWIFTLLAILGITAFEQWALAAPGSSHEQAIRVGTVHVLMALLVLASLVLMLQAAVVPGRISGLLENMPRVYFQVRSQILPTV